jgi:uncharacterized membrane protein
MSAEITAPFSAREALRFGWTTALANLKPLLAIGAAGAVLALFDMSLERSADGLSALLRLFVSALQIAVAMIWVKVSLTLADGKPLEKPVVSAHLERYFSYLLGSVLYGLIVTAGLVLLIVPGVLWAAQFGFAGFLIVDRKVDPIEALRQSSHLTEGARGPLIAFAALLMVLNFLGLCAAGLGLLVTVPASFIAAARVYRILEARAGHAPVAPIAPTATAGV